MNKAVLVANRAAGVTGAVVGLIFLVSGVVYLCLGHWPVTHLDYWGLYEIYFGQTWLESALRKSAEHLMFFPTLLCLADLRFFHGNQELLFIIGLILLCTTAGLLLIPVWSDQTISSLAKIMATLAIIVGNFWMARSPITGSGGFNCICSLLMANAALAFLFLPGIKASLPGSSTATLIVVSAAFVTSFSFGVGLAIWPTLLFLLWCLRLPRRSLVVVGVAAIAVIVIYQAIPPQLTGYTTLGINYTTIVELLSRLCRLVGGPFFYAASGWHQNPLSAEAARSSILSLCCGGAGLGLAIFAMSVATIRRDLLGSGLKLTGIALVAFNFVVMALISAGNYFRNLEGGFIAPRYLFWSTLFWTGLLLVAIQCAEFRRWLRWPVWLLALALPFLIFPMHYKSGLHGRRVRMMADYGAVSLVNGVRDDSQVRIFGGGDAKWVNWVYRVAKQLRVRRLDMFADGLQDWIGLHYTDLFGRRQKHEGLTGSCRVIASLDCENGATAARIAGQVTKKRHLNSIVQWAITPASWILGQDIKTEYVAPRTLVIVDPAGVIRGIGRSLPTSKLINRLFYLDRLNTTGFLGYICDYDPQVRYVVHSADNRVFSEDEIPVQAPTTESAFGR
jgi:hypothetical protein